MWKVGVSEREMLGGTEREIEMAVNHIHMTPGHDIRSAHILVSTHNH